MKKQLKPVEKVEILTLQDNYIDFFSFKGNNQIIQRPVPVKPTVQGLELTEPPAAEHGWSSVVSVAENGSENHLLFDFGWSENGAAKNAKLLNVDLQQIDVMALSHGHIDHFGGLKALYKMIQNPEVELVLHPEAFRNPRYGKVMGDKKFFQPCLTHEFIEDVGVKLNRTDEPLNLLDDKYLFLTGIPRKTDFEMGMPGVFYVENGVEKPDHIDDDSAIVVHLKNKGLVIVSGCGHAGIVNTVEYAKEVTGIDKVHAIIGGFHLTGPEFKGIIQPTVDALKAINPDYIVPTHCTGREAIMAIEKAMPENFILNMSGTKLIFK